MAARARGTEMGNRATAVAILNPLLALWQEGVNAHRPEAIAAVFTEDAIFQGLQPYSVGRAGVQKYYSAQPRDMRVTYDIVEARLLGKLAVLGYVRAEFSFDHRSAVSVLIGIVATRQEDRWQIAHYQVSPPPHGVASRPA